MPFLSGHSRPSGSSGASGGKWRPDLELLSPSIGVIIPLGTMGIGPAHREVPVGVPGEGGEARCPEVSAGRGDVSVSISTIFYSFRWFGESSSFSGQC